MTRRLLRLKAAGEYLSMSVRTLQGMIQRGELPAVKGKDTSPWRLDIQDLDAWIERQKG